MPNTTSTNIILELDGLKDAFITAFAGVLDRTVTVLNRDYDGIYTGSYPLCLLRPDHWHMERLQGGVIGQKGQPISRPSNYVIELHDVIDPREAIGSRVAVAQTDQYLLIDAIANHFKVSTSRCLYDALGNKRAMVAGEPLDFKFSGPFRMEDGGEVRVVAVGMIGVVGIPQPGVLG